MPVRFRRTRESIGVVATISAAISAASVVVGVYLNAMFFGGWWWRVFLHRGDAVGFACNLIALLLGPFAIGRTRWMVIPCAIIALGLRACAHLAEYGSRIAFNGMPLVNQRKRGRPRPFIVDGATPAVHGDARRESQSPIEHERHGFGVAANQPLRLREE